jgi:hypothetical protein
MLAECKFTSGSSLQAISHMNIAKTKLAALLCAIMSISLSAQTITYNFAFDTTEPTPGAYGPWSVEGSIVTDGTIGTLQADNILSWYLSTASPQASGSGTGINGTSGMLKFNTTSLVATEDKLIMSGGSLRLLVGNLYTRIYFEYGSDNIRIFAGGLASTIPNQTYSDDLPLTVNEDGSWTIATAAVPEPSTYAAVLGCSSLLLVLFKRKRMKA